MESVRICRIPACQMVSAGPAMFGEGVLEAFSDWFGAFPRTVWPQDYLWFDGQGFVWYYVYQQGMKVPDECRVVDFPGGLYAVATSRDADNESYSTVMQTLEEFIRKSDCFEKDDTRAQLGNVITPPEAQALGYEQMDHYLPIRLRKE